MKKLTLFIIGLVFLLAAPSAWAFETRYADAVFGGQAGAMDAINGSDVSDGDHCEVVDAVSGYKSIYVLDADSGAAQNPPFVVTPITNAGTKRWILWSLKAQNLETEALTAGSVPQYREVFIPASAFIPLNTGGALAGTSETTTNSIMFDFLDYDQTAEEGAQVNLALIGYRSGSIKCRFAWAPASDDGVAAQTVEWEAHLMSLGDGATIDAAPASAVITDAALTNESAEMHITAATPVITPTNGMDINRVTVLVVTRNVAGTDNLAADARLYGVYVQYPFDGSASVAAW